MGRKKQEEEQEKAFGDECPILGSAARAYYPGQLGRRSKAQSLPAACLPLASMSQFRRTDAQPPVPTSLRPRAPHYALRLDPLGTKSLRSFGSTGKWAVTCRPFFGQDPTAATVRTDPGIYIAVLVPERTLSPNTSWYFQP